jgi:hypothetical protein
MPRAAIAAVPVLVSFAVVACEKSGPLANLGLDASAPAASASAAASTASASAAADAGGREMPPRPVPKETPTVTITMPMETQLKAIQYMEAMKAPQKNDLPADATYAQHVADLMKSFGKTEVISSGRSIDITMVKGCDAHVPRAAITQTGISQQLLLAHGILVVRCADKNLQCLQSVRDLDDVLCVHR